MEKCTLQEFCPVMSRHVKTLIYVFIYKDQKEAQGFKTNHKVFQP